MKLPTKIKVAAFDIDIEDWHHHSANAAHSYGEFSSQENKIRIDVTTNKIKLIDTFIHEINHAIFWAYGIEDEDKEERVVATLATAWVQIYRDNPDILPFIQDTLEAA